ncbi:MAG TPA: RHS repeat-associated core domain-containing protein [Mycobacterium sp.]|nr:RHS repeat-associated core domain-containing protein [Mycobacterium sp.]
MNTTFNRTVTNPNGKQAVYQYQRASNTAYLQGVNGQPSANCPASANSLTYDSNNFIASATDEEGRVTTYVREARGLPTSITRGAGTSQAVTTTYSWHPTFAVPTEVVRPGLTTDYAWNALGQLTEVTETDTTTQTVPYATGGQTRAWTYTYTTGGLVASIDGPLAGGGDTVSYAYNSNGYLQSVTNEVGLTTRFTSWNGRGEPTSMTDPNGVVTNFVYDPLGRLTSIAVDPTGVNAVTSFAYNVVGDITRITRPNGAFLNYGYDDARRIVAVTDNTGASISYGRDPMGNVTSVKFQDGSGALQLTQTATFDELGRLLTFVGAAGQTWTHGYDRTDNEVSVTDPRSNVRQWAFDALNRLISTTDEDGSVVALARDGQDNVTAYTDPRTLTTSYLRDGFGDVIERVSPDTGTTVYQYNAQGKPTSITDGRGVVTNLGYDNSGRLLSKQYPAAPGENVTYTWDATANGNNGAGRITEIDDASGSVQWAYDTLGRIVQETKTTAGVVYTIGYAYDADGNVTQITYPSGRTVGYARDALGRISGVTMQANAASAPVTLASNFAYEPFGPLQSLWYGSGLDLWKTFTQDYLIDVLLVQDTSTSTTLIDRAHGRTDSLNLTNIWDNVDTTRNESYWYTASNRLQNTSGLYGALTYYYDGVGNRTYEILTQGSTTATSVYGYPATSNLLTQITQGATTVRSLTYDGAGNIVGDSRSGTLYGYAYNDRNRLAQVSVGGQVTASYVYDGLERMAIRSAPGLTPSGTTHYLYDLSGRLMAEASSSGTILTEYAWVDDLPLAVFANLDTAAPNLWYVHADHLNRPIKMTDGTTKAVVWDAVYWPFGAVYAIGGAATNNLRFPGQYFLLESGLHYNWHRHYDPTLGRYTQPDPLAIAAPTSVVPVEESTPTADSLLSARGLRDMIAVNGSSEWPLGGAATHATTEFVDGPSLYAYANSSPAVKFDSTGQEVGANFTPIPPSVQQCATRGDNMSHCLPLYVLCQKFHGTSLLINGKRCGDCHNMCLLDGIWPFHFCPLRQF